MTLDEQQTAAGRRSRARRSDVASLGYFIAIARHRNFRLAGLELGLSASALSHSLRVLESNLGARLFNRTNRSVTLTAAGEALLADIEHPFDSIDHAIDNLNRFKGSPSGNIRLNVLEAAATYLIAPVLPTFIERYPEVHIDLRASNAMIDVTEGGFDAGIRYGNTVPEDMITQRLTADMRWVVVGAPSYFARYGRPQHPRDLLSHQCSQIRLGDERIYRWEFDREDEQIDLAVPGTITIDASATAHSLARHGAALVYTAEPTVAAEIARGELEIVLEDWASMGPAMHIYYSGRRHLPVGLRLLIDLIRELKPLGY